MYYVPETRAYRVSSSTELFPQHCQLPTITPHQHFRKLTNELAVEGTKVGNSPQGRRLLQMLQMHIRDILVPPLRLPQVPTIPAEQRVNAEQQRVIDDTPISTIPRITDAPHIMTSRNLMAKRHIKITPLVHKRHTRRNTPGGVPLIQRKTLPTPITPAADPTSVQ